MGRGTVRRIPILTFSSTRLLNSRTLTKSIAEGLSLLTWEQDSFAWADAKDESADRYRGLRYGTSSSAPDPDSPGLLVKSAVAFMTNRTLRERFGIEEKNYSMVSLVINESKRAGLIKDADPESKSRRDARYVPFYA